MMMAKYVETPYSDHPLSQIFPLHEGQPLWELADHIKQHGLLEEIILLDGQILDGRRRYLACLKSEIPCRFRTFGSRATDGDSPLAFVYGQNFHRRHLDSKEQIYSKSQFAMMAVKTEKQTQTEKASAHDISKSSVQRAQVVLKKGSESLRAALETGEISIRDASLVAHQEPEIQNKAVEMVKMGSASTLADAIKTIMPDPPESKPGKILPSLVQKTTATLHTLVRYLDRLRLYDEPTKEFLTRLAERIKTDGT